MNECRQGDIVWANLDPVHGSEQAGKRPVVIISGDAMNGGTTNRIVCPLTTQMKQKHRVRVFVEKNSINGLAADSEVLVAQVRTLSIDRFGKTIGCVSGTQLKEIKELLVEILE